MEYLSSEGQVLYVTCGFMATLLLGIVKRDNQGWQLVVMEMIEHFREKFRGNWSPSPLKSFLFSLIHIRRVFDDKLVV